jgi:hypothetical protein
MRDRHPKAETSVPHLCRIIWLGERAGDEGLEIYSIDEAFSALPGSGRADIWTAPDTPRSKSLMRAMDRLNSHYGRDTLAYAVTGRRKARPRLPRYTTGWDELLAV